MVRRAHSVTTGAVVKRYLCAHCGYTQNARIRATGYAAALSRSGAGDASADNHTDDALRTLALTRCPSCRRRQRSLATELTSTAIAAAAIAGLLWLIGVLAFRRGVPLLFSAGAVALVALYAGVRLARSLRSDSRVEFVGKASIAGSDGDGAER